MYETKRNLLAKKIHKNAEGGVNNPSSYLSPLVFACDTV